MSETTNSLKLEEIRRRCRELDNESADVLELTLEDPKDQLKEGFDPYNTTSFRGF